jgi:tetratricopeptide (TPR) repeat protein/CHAT domain-containing protein
VLIGHPHSEVATSLEKLGRIHERLGHYEQAENAYKSALSIQRGIHASAIDIARVSGLLASLYSTNSRFDEAEQYYKEALSLQKQALGEDNPGIVEALDGMWMLYEEQGRYAEAALYCNQAIAIYEKNSDAFASDLAAKLGILASLYTKQKRFDEAEALYRRVLSMSETRHLLYNPFVNSLYALALFLKDRYRHEEAAALLERVLAIDEKEHGPNSLELVDTILNLANVYQQMGRFADEELLLKRNLDINIKAYGISSPNNITSLSELGGTYRLQGRYPEAEAHLKKALAIAKKFYGQDSAEAAVASGELGQLYDIQGKFREAEDLFKRAFEVEKRELGINDPVTARGAMDLAVLYREIGRYAESEALFKQLISAQGKSLTTASGSDKPLAAALGRALALSNDSLGSLYAVQGRYREAEERFRYVLQIAEEKLDRDDLIVSATSNNLAQVYSALGRQAEQEELLQKSLAIINNKLGAENGGAGSVVANLGLLYFSQQRFAEAEELLKRAIALHERKHGQNHPDLAVPLERLGDVYVVLGRFDEAETLYRRALIISERAFGPNHSSVATALSGLGNCEIKRGHFAAAEASVRRALAIQEMALGQNHPNVANTLQRLAEAMIGLGRYDEAEKIVRQALSISESALGPRHSIVAIRQNSLATIARKRDRYADALPPVLTTISNGFADATVALPILLRAQELQLIARSDAIDLALEVFQQDTNSAAARAVDKLAIRLAAGNDRLAQLVRKDQDVATETSALNTSLVQAVSKELSKRDLLAELRMRERLGAIAKERQDISQILTREFPDYAALSHPAALSAKQIQDLLSGDEALVAFSVGLEETHVIALTRDSIAWHSIPLGRATISDHVAAFRQGLDVDRFSASVIAGKPELFDLARSYKLFSTLLGPIDGVIKDKKTVAFVPSGALTALPFHLLVTEPPTAGAGSPGARFGAEDLLPYLQAAWLLNRQAVSILPSIASLKTLRVLGARTHASKPLIGFGDPIFNPDASAPPGPSGTTRGAGTSAGYTEFWHGAGVDRQKLAEGLPRLESTADELRAVAKSLGAPDSDVHLRENATETLVKNASLKDFRTVYFATHGLVAGDIKGLAEPSLALSLPRQASDFDDGLLTASDVTQLKLNADWVVLSACNTIAGDKPGAEALSGFARAFFYAGAKSLLVTHWSAASDAATRLTTATFDILKSDTTVGRPEALRRAMIVFRQDKSDPLNAYPAMWGPFTLIGVETR